MASTSFAWERLSGADASNFVLEHPGRPSLIGVVGELDVEDDGLRPDGDIDGLRRLLAPRVAAVDRLNQRVLFTRTGQGRPVWVDCPPDLTWHVRLGPDLADDAARAELCGRLLDEPLRRDRPLWDLLVCRGPGPRTCSVVLRLHHALADGISGAAIMLALFDPPPGSPRDPVPRRAVRRLPTDDELRADARRSRRAAALATARRLGRPATWRAVRFGLVRSAVVLRGGLPATSLLGPLGSRRAVGLVRADLDGVRRLAHDAGVHLNDVLLDAVTTAVDDALRSRGEHLAELPVSVPVSLRANGSGGPAGNRVGVMRIVVPVGADDDGSREPTGRLDRLHRIAADTRDAKEEARAAGTFELTRSRLGTRLFDLASRRQRTIALFVTNVPGPTTPLTLAGARLRHAWPLTANAGNVRVAVSALSYAGTLHVTVTADRRAWPDVTVFTRPLAAALRPPSPPSVAPDASPSEVRLDPAPTAEPGSGRRRPSP